MEFTLDDLLKEVGALHLENVALKRKVQQLESDVRNLIASQIEPQEVPEDKEKER